MSDETPVMPPVPPEAHSPGTVGEPDGTTKLLAVLGYLLWVVAIVVLLIDPYKSQYFSRAHAVQALVLGIIIWGVAWIPIVGWLIAFVAFVFAVIALLKALKGEVYEMPIVFNLAKSFIEG